VYSAYCALGAHTPRSAVRKDGNSEKFAGLGVLATKRIGDEIHVDVDEARSGQTLNVMRYVLGISLLLAIAALSAIWISAAPSQRTSHGWPVTAEQHALGGG